VIYPDDEDLLRGEGGYGNSTIEVRDDGTFGDDGDRHRGGRFFGGGHRCASRAR